MPISDEDKHKIPLMIELLRVREKDLYIEDNNYDNNDVLMTIDDLAVNWLPQQNLVNIYINKVTLTF